MNMAEKKASTQIGQGAVMIFGLVFGMVLALIFWGWYLSGFSDSTTVLISAILVIFLILIIDWIIMIFWKKLGGDYEKGIWWGIGFIIAILVVTFLLGLIGLTSLITVGLVIPYLLRNKAQCGSISQ